MKLWIMSDLHQEWPQNAYVPVPPSDGFDVAVLAGDVHTPLVRSLEWARSVIPEGRIVYVPGNHDFYRLGDGGPSYTWEDQVERGLLAAPELGIDLLVDSSVEIDGVLFAGGTLWTDLRATYMSPAAAAGDAKRSMNDYKRIHRRSQTRGSRAIRPEHTLAMHRATKAFLEEAASGRRDGQPFVIVTHHPPSMRTVDNPGASCSQCYGSDLEGWATGLGADLWIHGHTHHHLEYGVGALKFVTNARGHWSEKREFIEGFVLELPSPVPGLAAIPA